MIGADVGFCCFTVVRSGGKTFHPNHPPDWDGERSWSLSEFPYYPFSYYNKSANATYSNDHPCPGRAVPKKHPANACSDIDTYCHLDEDEHSFYDHGPGRTWPHLALWLGSAAHQQSCLGRGATRHGAPPPPTAPDSSAADSSAAALYLLAPLPAQAWPRTPSRVWTTPRQSSKRRARRSSS